LSHGILDQDKQGLTRVSYYIYLLLELKLVHMYWM